ncbi:unnamed protein product [Rhizopus stolonifer]
MYYEDPDAMDYEYTHPHLLNTFNYDSLLTKQSYTKKQYGFFAESIFDTNDESADNVCNLFNNVSLTEKKESEKDEKDKAIVLYHSPLTPEKDNNPDIPSTTTQEPPENILHHHHAHNYQTPTFIYNQAPLPVIDPLAEKYSTIYYITGLLRIGFISIIFSISVYLFFEMTRFIHHDMKAKIANYESNELNEQMYCQTQYELNQCSLDKRLPAIAEWCQELENCMSRSVPLSKSKILAETLAEFLDGFSNTLTIKTMILSVITGISALWSITSILAKTKDNQYHQTITKK